MASRPLRDNNLGVPDSDVTGVQLRLLSAVHDLWSHANGVWPVFAQVDKYLDERGVDAEPILLSLAPRWLRLDGRGGGSLPGQRVILTVRGLAEIDPPPLITETFLEAVRFAARVEQAHEPEPPDRFSPRITTADLAEDLERSGSIPRPPDVAYGLASAVGELLLGEGHLWSWFGPSEDGTWAMEISRRVRKFRDVASLRDYLEVVDDARAVENRTDAEAVQEARAAVVGVSADDENVVDPRRVFVVHGRDLQAKAAVYQFLRDIDLHPLDWEELVAATGVAAPYIGDTVAAAFRIAQAVVVLLTPDDDARLHPSLRGATEAAHEVNLAGQARPNVLFEAGMALASHPDRTVLVEIGQLRPFSDVAGRHTVRLDGNASTLNALATRLQSAGCAVNLSGSDWLNVVPFMDLDAHTRRPAEEPHQG